VKGVTLGGPALRVHLGLVAALLLASAGAFSQAITIPELSRARDAVVRKKSITEIEKRQILELYDQSIKSIEAGLRFRALQLGQERTRVAMQRELAALQEEVRRPASAPSAPHQMDKKDWLPTVLALLPARPPAAGLFSFRYDAICKLRGLCTSQAVLYI
jgi:hypothetical protein